MQTPSDQPIPHPHPHHPAPREAQTQPPPSVQRPGNQMSAEAAIPECTHLQSRAIFHVLWAILKQVCKTGILIDDILAYVCACLCSRTHVSGHLWWGRLLPGHPGTRVGWGGVAQRATGLIARFTVCCKGAEPSGIGGERAALQSQARQGVGRPGGLTARGGG